MIQWTSSKTPCILCVALALGCGGRAETPGSATAGGMAASSGTSGVATGGQGGAGGDSAAQGGAVGTDACQGKVCNTPPSNACAGGMAFLSYDTTGSCSEGMCSYVSHRTACLCQNGACSTDPCMGLTCASPPSAVCTDSNTQTTYATCGTCSAGSCSYAPTSTACAFGCAKGACKPDPCASVTCNAQPAAICKTATMVTTYAVTGTCSGAGTCSYAPTDTPCGTNEVCSGVGVCSECKADTSCGGECEACGGGTPKCKDLGTTSQCVGCLSDADCSSATPLCDTSTNTCGTPPSCVGLAATCGPNANASCCASSVVTGTTAATNPPFYRSYDGAGFTSTAYPAVVSDFRLDTYEITVGRFRKFATAYQQPLAGSGNNPNNPFDTGWEVTWNSGSLDATPGALTGALKCGYQTWTDVAGTAEAESLPINCLGWFEAEAFCIWDSGRLPTEAEWNYAAAGGTQQRMYPWGSAAPDCTYANFYGAAGGINYCVAPGTVNRVGSESPKGDGLYGQADLAGNVWEWVQDEYLNSYTNPCNNCAATTFFPYPRVVRGGRFDGNASNLLSSSRSYSSPSDHSAYYGGRCARTR